MKTHIITKDQLDKDNYYIGSVDLSYFDGHLESEKNLGYVKFKRGLAVTGYIVFRPGSGIEAGWGIKAGLSIESGMGIEAGWGIKSGMGIKSGLSIESGEGIEAGEGIECKGVLSFAKRLFAGTSVYQDTTAEIKTVICGKIKGGVVCYGDVTETGVPQEKSPTVVISEGDNKAQAIEKLEAALAILRA